MPGHVPLSPWTLQALPMQTGLSVTLGPLAMFALDSALLHATSLPAGPSGRLQSLNKSHAAIAPWPGIFVPQDCPVQPTGCNGVSLLGVPLPPRTLTPDYLYLPETLTPAFWDPCTLVSQIPISPPRLLNSCLLNPSRLLRTPCPCLSTSAGFTPTFPRLRGLRGSMPAPFLGR